MASWQFLGETSIASGYEYRAYGQSRQYQVAEPLRLQPECPLFQRRQC